MAETRKEDENYTHPEKCSNLRKGGYAILKGKPCKIVDMSTAKPGKHGHAKVNLVGLDLFTGKRVEDMHPSTHTVSVPDVKREEILISDVSDTGDVSLLLDSAELMNLRLTKECDKSVDDVVKTFEEVMTNGEDEMVAVVMSAMGNMVIKDVKTRKPKY